MSKRTCTESSIAVTFVRVCLSPYTRDGIRLVFQVEPNQEFHGLVCEGANVLPSKFLQDSFCGGYGKIVNVRCLEEEMSSINWWYTERGLFGLVSGVEILSGGVIRLEVVEAEVNNISICFRDRKTGEPTRGKTKPENILQQLTTKKGQVYSVFQGKRDVETVLTMGIMEDVSIIPQPAGDTDKVDLIMNVVERPTGGFSAGGGISSGITSGPLSGLIGSSAYSHRNVFGGNQKLNISLERGQIDSIFHINYTDPWIEGDDRRTSRTIMVQHAGACDEKGNPVIKDFYSSPLTASGKSHDKILIAKVESVYTGSGDQCLQCLFSMWNKDLLFCLSGYFLIRVTAYVRKCIEVGPACVLLSLSGGHVVGNFLPHEAFAMGGTNSVRGYAEGAVGSGRSYVVVSSEISFPMLGPVEGVIFSDYGTDLGSGPTVPVILLGQD